MRFRLLDLLLCIDTLGERLAGVKLGAIRRRLRLILRVPKFVPLGALATGCSYRNECSAIEAGVVQLLDCCVSFREVANGHESETTLRTRASIGGN